MKGFLTSQHNYLMTAYNNRKNNYVNKFKLKNGKRFKFSQCKKQVIATIFCCDQVTSLTCDIRGRCVILLTLFQSDLFFHFKSERASFLQ